MERSRFKGHERPKVHYYIRPEAYERIRALLDYTASLQAKGGSGSDATWALSRIGPEGCGARQDEHPAAAGLEAPPVLAASENTPQLWFLSTAAYGRCSWQGRLFSEHSPLATTRGGR